MLKYSIIPLSYFLFDYLGFPLLAIFAPVFSLGVLLFLSRENGMISILSLHSDKKFHNNVKEEIDEYMNLADNTDIERKKKQYESLITLYYNLATDFYEFGWGESFHFAPRHKRESFTESIARAEHYVALRLGLKPGMKVLDLGAGVGGPMREIARFSGATIIGVNTSKYQIDRGNAHNKRNNLDHLCSFVEADFMKLPFENSSIDAVYAIEATVHAPDRGQLFKEIHRVLKPGGRFASYEWCVTHRYDKKNQEHIKVKQEIELGNALPELLITTYSDECLKKAGFKLLEGTDFGERNKLNPIPWYDKLQARYSLSNFKSTRLGIWITYIAVKFLETLGIAPKGSSKTSEMLQIGARSLVRGGELGIFTPSYFIVGEKLN